MILRDEPSSSMYAEAEQAAPSRSRQPRPEGAWGHSFTALFGRNGHTKSGPAGPRID